MCAALPAACRTLIVKMNAAFEWIFKWLLKLYEIKLKLFICNVLEQIMIEEFIKDACAVSL